MQEEVSFPVRLYHLNAFYRALNLGSAFKHTLCLGTLSACLKVGPFEGLPISCLPWYALHSVAQPSGLSAAP